MKDTAPIPRLLSAIWRSVDFVRRIVNEITNHPRVTTFGSLIIFLVSLKLISKELNQYALADLSIAFDEVRISTTMGAIIAVIGSYFVLSLNDRFCLSMIGKSLPVARTTRASIASYALAKTLGYSWAIASTARARLYRKWGLTQGEIGALSMTSGTSVHIGGLSAAALGLLFGASEIAKHGRFDEFFWLALSVVMALPIMLWLYYLGKGNISFNWGVTKVRLLALRRGLAQLACVMFDKMGAALALYLLLPDHGGWSFPPFLAVFILAGLLGALSGAPGGLGVFEAAILTMAPTTQNIPGAAVALVVFRLIYNIIPLIGATIILGLDHAAPAARPAARAAIKIGVKAVDVAPQILAILVFIAGYVLIAGAALPVFSTRFVKLEAFLSPNFLEIAHFLNAIVGMALMLCANFIWREKTRVYWFSLGLLFVAIILSLLRGIAWEIAAVLTIVFALSFSTYSEFGAIDNDELKPISFRWVAAIIGSLASIIWFSYFAYQNTPYAHDLWLQTGAGANAARAMRALSGAACTMLIGTLTIWLLAKAGDTDED